MNPRTVAELLHAGKALSSREIQVLQAMADGEFAAGTAARLELSEETIKSHKRAIQGKLRASSGTHAVAIGLRRGLIQ